MQVNVKELTGVLHLRLVFMNVLVLQSFLAVSLQVFQVLPSFQAFQVQVSQVFLLSQVLAPVWLNHFKHLNCISSKLPVYKLLAPTMAEAVTVHSLDLMDSYYTLSVSSSH